MFAELLVACLLGPSAEGVLGKTSAQESRSNKTATGWGTPPIAPEISGGAPTFGCTWPNVVHLDQGCSGTLVHPRLVLFAAHCSIEQRTARFGNSVEDEDGFEVDIENCVRHPSFFGLGTGIDQAYCVLTRPVENVPIVPIAAGCETTLIHPGRDVTLVGFGFDEHGDVGHKRAATTEILALDRGEIYTGGGGIGSCDGDSGGPVFMRLPDEGGGDGSWRQIGIVSWGPTCGLGGWSVPAHTALPWIEEETGFDLSPCGWPTGEWSPGPGCGGFPITLEDSTPIDREHGCPNPPRTATSASCGPAFDPEVPFLPLLEILQPSDRQRFASEADGFARVELHARVEGQDVQDVGLLVDGSLLPASLKRAPPWHWSMSIPPGLWEITVVAGNGRDETATSTALVLAVDRDPPELERIEDEPGSTEAGCAIARHHERSPFTCLGLWGWFMRRRWRALRDHAPVLWRGHVHYGLALISLALLSLALLRCQAPPANETESEATSDVASESPSSTSDDACPVGIPDCPCSEDDDCGPGHVCRLHVCTPCETGRRGCPCDENDGCHDGLLCLSELCSTPPPCPFTDNGRCDEPDIGTGYCYPGTDHLDCCGLNPDPSCPME